MGHVVARLPWSGLTPEIYMLSRITEKSTCCRALHRRVKAKGMGRAGVGHAAAEHSAGVNGILCGAAFFSSQAKEA